MARSSWPRWLKESYTESDLEALRLLAGQAVVAVNNALLYRKEQQRSVEMQGLANLAQSTTAVRDPQELYTHLIESIARLVDVEVLGFLIYDESRRLLAGQDAFYRPAARHPGMVPGQPPSPTARRRRSGRPGRRL